VKKPIVTAAEAVADIADGSVLLAGGFAGSGYPLELFEALADRGVHGLTLVCLNGGQGEEGAARLVMDGAIDRLICSYPLGARDKVVREAVESGRMAMELVPQGTLAEAIRAGGAGLGGALTRTGLGTEFAKGREIVTVRGVEYLLEPAIRGDVAFIRAHEADPWGNLRYRYAQQNFNPFMAMAARTTIAHVDRIVPDGIEPTTVHTPGVFVNRIVVD
jgi:3-oxoadipate CoA-transferase, alpha subunit